MRNAAIPLPVSRPSAIVPMTRFNICEKLSIAD
jgi:hypothetical protein